MWLRSGDCDVQRHNLADSASGSKNTFRPLYDRHNDDDVAHVRKSRFERVQFFMYAC